MEILPIGSVQGSAESGDFYRKRKKFSFEEDRRSSKKIPKVLDLALQKLSQPSSLFAAASSPNIVIELLTDFPVKKTKNIQFPSLLRQEPLKPKNTPIGMQKCEYNNWINALMQFLIFIPSLSEMFAYTPQTLSPFIDYIDQYRKDQKQGKGTTHTTSQKLLEALRKKFHTLPCKKDPVHHFLEILELIMKCVCENPALAQETDLLALHNDWRISLDPKAPLSWEEHIEKHCQQNGFFDKASVNFFLPFPTELLISLKTDTLLPKKQFFLSYQSTPCALYELDAFIEYRPDGWEKGNFLTYLKLEGEWLQCDDTRIIPLRPINLPIPLRRSFLFHYKKVGN